MILNWKITLSFLCIILLCIACRHDNSGQSEEESAYLADYESPSDHWGFINEKGELVIEARYDDAGPFSQGLAAVNKDGKWGYINQKGEMVIDPVYKSAWAFHEGYARVLPFDGPDQFIDSKGKAIPAENWTAADDFSNGMARVKVGNSFGYIDSQGKLVIPPIFTRGWNFSNGISVVEYQEKLGVIDRQGNYVLEPVFDQIKKAGGDKIILCRQSNEAFAYDDRGDELLKFANSKMYDSDGENISIRQNNQMFLVTLADPTNKSNSYSNIIYLEENRWAGKTDSGYVLLGREGTPVSHHHYTQINKFSDGYAAYSKGDYWGYLDTAGNELTGEVFGLAWDYREGFARAAFKEGIAFIDKNQNLAFYPPAGSLDMRDFSEGLAAVQLE